MYTSFLGLARLMLEPAVIDARPLNVEQRLITSAQVIAAGRASSMSLSIFLVDVLRSLAIPARLVGAPAGQ